MIRDNCGEKKPGVSRIGFIFWAEFPLNPPVPSRLLWSGWIVVISSSFLFATKLVWSAGSNKWKTPWFYVPFGPSTDQFEWEIRNKRISQLNAPFVLVYVQVKRLLVKAAWSILFLERRFYPIPINAQQPPYGNWSLERDAVWWYTLKTRILKQNYLYSQQDLLIKATLNRSPHLLMRRLEKVQMSKRSSFFGRTAFWRYIDLI